MAKVKVLDQSGAASGDINLNDDIFGIEPNEYAVHEAVKNHLANKRQGTQSTKTRGEVRGGGAKPFRQKGTGRARQGSSRSPINVGGGVVFAPKPRDYSYKLPKKVKRLAMKSALSAKVKDKEIIVVDKLTFDAPKTKEMAKFLEAVKAEKKALIVIEGSDQATIKSAANLQGIMTTRADELNVYDIVNHTSLIVTKDAVKKIEEVYS